MTPLPSGLSTRPESFAPSGESTLRLQRAIESLALNLDDELHRYRQNRSGQGAAIPTPARLQLRQNRKPIDLIALKTAAGAAAATPPPPPPNAHLQELLGQASVPNSQAYPPNVNQVRLSHGGTLTTYRPSPEEYLESTEALLGSRPNHPQPELASDEHPPSLIRQLTSPLGIGALLLLLVGSASFGYLVTSPEAVSHLSDNPIARRLKGTLVPADGAASDAASEGLASQGKTGFDPLGPDLSEQEFSSIDLDDISTLPSANSPTPVRNVPVQTQLGETPGAESATEGDRAAGSAPATPRPGVLTPAGGRPSSPNSAVVRANIVAAPRPAVTTQPSAVRSAPTPSRPAPSRPAPAAPATPPPAVRVAPPAANAQPPQPLARDRAPTAPATAAPAVAPPAPITQAPPQAAPSHYVVTDYNGASSLESARGAVGDAYVRDFSGSTRIQMGAFSQESSARDLQQQLEGQGIPAQVISP